MEVEYILELSKAAVPQDDDHDHDHDATAVSSSDIDFAAETMVGHSTQFTEIREYLLRRMRPDDVWYFSIFGELGGGRSHIANCLFEDLRRCGQQFFDCFAWVKLGTVTELKGVFVRILAQLDKLSGHYSEMRISKDDRTFSELQKVTRNRRYMIVLDDVRDVPVMEYLLRKLPDQSNGSVVVFTTSSDEVSKYADNVNRYGTPRHFFEETVWISLRSLLFLEESIPPELEEAGKKIVKNCRGLYIPAAKTVLFLRKTEISVEHWRKLAADEQNPIFVVEDEILELPPL
ncbi:hypothetical protein C2S52_022875 [Perilla frutescens var. hirtella]|nr:hypothetical protein C2S52_022875 [Perilla frutescens var. hirtella]KAH6817065.1 hypothetical protein C2S51_000668 [Perilla frutescens var. frutescens]